ncbi:hypothetical protein HanOQP8_Chr09g0310771 [Helianthus annuus]|nr:hypothetical protein HanHA89_Chr09g0324901 [Helianthus annuus]KAJ0706208.1 hypothetical protein HanLR1_Chr09g0304421 [Helianthus annuus]KAJ0710297.1 hypothetical protein HanOQP8_Chr09g0310771 [Helianthus annuus]
MSPEIGVTGDTRRRPERNSTQHRFVHRRIFFRSFAGTIRSLSGLLSLRLVHRGTPQPCRRTKHHRRSSQRRQPEFTKEPNSFFLLFRSPSTPSETSRKTQDLAGDIFYSLSFQYIFFDLVLFFRLSFLLKYYISFLVITL